MIIYWTREGRFEAEDNYHLPYPYLHREDGPAVKWSYGKKWWCWEGKLHRVGAPAITLPDGSKFWQIMGRFHRTDGPAVSYPDGSKMWCIDDSNFTLENFVHYTPYLTSDAERLAFYLRWK